MWEEFSLSLWSQCSGHWSSVAFFISAVFIFPCKYTRSPQNTDLEFQGQIQGKKGGGQLTTLNFHLVPGIEKKISAFQFYKDLCGVRAKCCVTPV